LQPLRAGQAGGVREEPCTIDRRPRQLAQASPGQDSESIGPGPSVLVASASRRAVHEPTRRAHAKPSIQPH
jgi:hypothetical protein